MSTLSFEDRLTLLHQRILRAEEELERLNAEYSGVWEAAKAAEDSSVSLGELIDMLPTESEPGNAEDELLESGDAGIEQQVDQVFRELENENLEIKHLQQTIIDVE